MSDGFDGGRIIMWLHPGFVKAIGIEPQMDAFLAKPCPQTSGSVFASAPMV